MFRIDVKCSKESKIFGRVTHRDYKILKNAIMICYIETIRKHCNHIDSNLRKCLLYFKSANRDLQLLQNTFGI